MFQQQCYFRLLENKEDASTFLKKKADQYSFYFSDGLNFEKEAEKLNSKKD